MNCTCYVSFIVDPESKDQVIEYLSLAHENSELKPVLTMYDTKIRDIECDGGIIRLSLSPDDYPEEIYETIFEFIEKNNCRKICVKEVSEFGTRAIEYCKGNLSVVSNLPIDVEASDSETESEPPLETVDLGAELYSVVTTILKNKLLKLPEYISPNCILGLNPMVFINTLDELRQKSKKERIDISCIHGTKSNQIELCVFSKSDATLCECAFIEFKKTYKTWPDVKAFSQSIDERFQQLGIARIPKSSRAYFKEFYGVWEWMQNNYIVYLHLQSNGGSNSDFELRLGVLLPRTLENVPEKYITKDYVMELTDWILKGQVVYERSLWLESVKRFGGEQDIGQENVEAYIQNWGCKISR